MAPSQRHQLAGPAAPQVLQQPERCSGISSVQLAVNRAAPGELAPAIVPNCSVVLERFGGQQPWGAVQAGAAGAAARLAVYDASGARLVALQRPPEAASGSAAGQQLGSAGGAAAADLPYDPALRVHVWDSGEGWFLLFPQRELALAFKSEWGRSAAAGGAWAGRGCSVLRCVCPWQVSLVH